VERADKVVMMEKAKERLRECIKRLLIEGGVDEGSADAASQEILDILLIAIACSITPYREAEQSDRFYINEETLKDIGAHVREKLKEAESTGRPVLDVLREIKDDLKEKVLNWRKECILGGEALWWL